MKKSAFAAASAVMAVSLGLAGAAEAATIRVVALTGQEAPGTGGAVFSSFGFGGLGSLGGNLRRGPSLNDAGDVAFLGEFVGPGISANGSGVFTSGALVARTGDLAPGVGGAVYSSFAGDPYLNNAGETAFRARLAGPGVSAANDSGVFTSGTLVAREGNVAPGAGAAVFADGFRDPALNDSGDVAFLGRLEGPGVTVDNDNVVFGSGALVAREGDVAPGTGGAVISALLGPALTNAGETVFYAGIDGASVIGGVFTPGGPLVRSGDAAPGIDGAVFAGIGGSHRPTLNDAGELAFYAGLAGAGITADNDGALFAAGTLVAREGDPAPGAGGAAYWDIQPGLNNAGDVAADVRLRGAGVTSDNDEAIFATRGGAFEMILREGDLLDIGGGELRPILSFAFDASHGFNDNGDIAFFADLGPIAGGGGVIGIGPGASGQGLSGIFVYEADRIPPPAVVPLPPAVGLMLAGMAALGVAGRRRRQSRPA